MATIASTIAVIFEAQDKTSAAVSAVEKSLGGVGTEADSSTSKVDKLGKEVEALGNKSSGAEKLKLALQALATSIIVKEFIDANVEAEKFDKAMTLLRGSSQAAAAEFEYVKNLAKTLGLELFTTADAYVQLSAATRGTALEGKGTRDIFEAVSKAMSSLGKSSADTQGALLAISQIVSKGTVSLEELRGQLGERLPGAFQIAASAMGVTTAELDKLVSSGNLTAEEFLPKFAAALTKSFGNIEPVEGFTAAMNRLRNTVDETFVELGKAGAFEALTRGIEIVTATLTGSINAIKLFGETVGNLAYTVSSGDFSGFGQRFEESVQKAANGTKDLVDAITGAGKATDQLNDKIRETDNLNANQSAAETARLLHSNAHLLLAEIEGAIRTISSLDQLNDVGGKLTAAFVSGKISAAEFERAVLTLATKQRDLSEAADKSTDSSKKNADALKRQADEARRAEENAQRMRLEMEKIASNERIKLVEARVTLNVEQFKAQAQQITAAFQSINTTIESTGSVLSTLFGLFENYSSLDWSAIRVIEQQIERENQYRSDALALQKDLTRAQIRVLEAQAENLMKGDAMIKIDGAGLQPHLEAFMWEILRSIQTRVNQDGLRMLLGV